MVGKPQQGGGNVESGMRGGKCRNRTNSPTWPQGKPRVPKKEGAIDPRSELAMLAFCLGEN